MPTMTAPRRTNEMHGPMYGTAPMIDSSRNMTPSGSQCGFTISHAVPMKSHDFHSVGSATVVAIGGVVGVGVGEKDAPSSGSAFAGTGSSWFLRISVVAVTRPSLTHLIRPGKSTGPYSFPPGTTTLY